MIVVAGPSDSGKTAAFPTGAFGVDHFNVDDRCAQLVGSYRSISQSIRRAVAGECECFVREHIDDGRPFAVETTLRTTAPIEQARLARERGFVTFLRFVSSGSIAESVARVVQRAQAGGHGASEGNIRAIYEASTANLAAAVAAFEFVNVYDSSERWALPRLVATKVRGELEVLPQPPQWLTAALRPKV